MNRHRAVRRLLRVGYGAMVAIPLVVALAGPMVAGAAPQERQVPFGESSWSPFGTDRLGRDVLAAALDGGRSLVFGSVAVVAVAYSIGFVIGMSAASAERQWIEDLLMRPVDVLLCVPALLVIIVVALRSNGSLVAIGAAIVLALLAPIARFVRMAARGIVDGPVMDALRLQGESWTHRYVRYAGRALARPIAADLGVRLVAAIYFLASANFLGIGLDTTSTDWAVTIAANAEGLWLAPWSVLVPGGLIVMLTVGINLLVDDVLADPREIAARDALRALRDEWECHDD